MTSIISAYDKEVDFFLDPYKGMTKPELEKVIKMVRELSVVYGTSGGEMQAFLKAMDTRLDNLIQKKELRKKRLEVILARQ